MSLMVRDSFSSSRSTGVEEGPLAILATFVIGAIGLVIFFTAAVFLLFLVMEQPSSLLWGVGVGIAYLGIADGLMRLPVFRPNDVRFDDYAPKACEALIWLGALVAFVGALLWQVAGDIAILELASALAGGCLGLALLMSIPAAYHRFSTGLIVFLIAGGLLAVAVWMSFTHQPLIQQAVAILSGNGGGPRDDEPDADDEDLSVELTVHVETTANTRVTVTIAPANLDDQPAGEPISEAFRHGSGPLAFHFDLPPGRVLVRATIEPDGDGQRFDTPQKIALLVQPGPANVRLTAGSR